MGESRKILSKLVLIRNHRPDTSLTVRGFFYFIMDIKFITGKSYEDLILELVQKNDQLQDKIRELSKEIEKNSTHIEFYKQKIAEGNSEYKVGEKIEYYIFGDKKPKYGVVSRVRLSSLGNVIYYVVNENGKKENTDSVQSIHKLQ